MVIVAIARLVVIARLNYIKIYMKKYHLGLKKCGHYSEVVFRRGSTVSSFADFGHH